jgi:hypothetical protein
MSQRERHLLQVLARGGTVRSQELERAGVTRSEISRMVAAGKVVRVARGLYSAAGYQSSEHGALVAVAKRVPRTLFCLLTALRFHDLTTQAPFEVWIAIGNKARAPRLDYPPIRAVRFTAESLTAGVETHPLREQAEAISRSRAEIRSWSHQGRAGVMLRRCRRKQPSKSPETLALVSRWCAATASCWMRTSQCCMGLPRSD